MKANAPKKIYLFENPITETPDDRWLAKRSDKNDIEYTRTVSLLIKQENGLNVNMNGMINSVLGTVT